MMEKSVIIPGGVVKLIFSPGLIEVLIKQTVEGMDWGTGNRMGRVIDHVDEARSFYRSEYNNKAEWQKDVIAYIAGIVGTGYAVGITKMVYANSIDGQ